MLYALDRQILLAFNSLLSLAPALDPMVAFFTNYSPAIFALFFAAYFLWPGTQRTEMRRTVLLSGLSGVMALLVTAVVTLFIYRARPFLVLPPDQLHLLTPHAPDSSFPSDHTMGSAAFAVGMWRAPSLPARWLFGITALLVGSSRLIAGVHWPSDVLGSLILGGLVAVGVFALRGLLEPLLDWVIRMYGRVEKRFVRTRR